jgi:hypothetical protein
MFGTVHKLNLIYLSSPGLYFQNDFYLKTSPSTYKKIFYRDFWAAQIIKNLNAICKNAFLTSISYSSGAIIKKITIT